MRNRILFYLVTCLLATHSALASTTIPASLPQDDTSASILAYYRIGEDAYPQSNLRTEQFNAHINEIITKDYNVIALPDLMTALKNKTPLPPKTIAITFEGAYQSTYSRAMRPLLEKNIPFTVFFAATMTDRTNHLNWKELRNLSKKKAVTLGIFPHTYTHIAHFPEAEQRRQINKARSDFRDKIGNEAQYFSYPFGEISTTLKTIIKEQSFTAAFGLQSGTAYNGHDIYALPRFTMTEQYGGLDRFRLVTNALPLPAHDIEPENPLITDINTAIGFTLPKALESQSGNLSCFISGHQEKPDLQKLGSRIELRPKEPLNAERTRINCTLPAPENTDETPRWRWFGMLLHSKL